MTRKIITTAVAFLAPFSIPFFVLASTCAANQVCNPLAFDTISAFLTKILQLVAEIGLPFIILFIVFIGFKFIAAEGKPEEIAKVQKLFFWAIVGSLIVIGAQALSVAIQGTVNDLSTGVTH